MDFFDYYMRQSFNLTFGLNILFVDVEIFGGRIYNDNQVRYFQSDNSYFWHFVKRYGDFGAGTPIITPLNMHGILRVNRMGYLYLLRPGQVWNRLEGRQKYEVIKQFNDTVADLKPAIVVVCGLGNYTELFRNVGYQVSSPEGLMKAQVFWSSRGMRSSKVFTIRKILNVNKRPEDVGSEFRSSIKELKRLRNLYDMNNPGQLPLAQRVQGVKNIADGFEVFFEERMNNIY